MASVNPTSLRCDTLDRRLLVLDRELRAQGSSRRLPHHSGRCVYSKGPAEAAGSVEPVKRSESTRTRPSPPAPPQAEP